MPMQKSRVKTSGIIFAPQQSIFKQAQLRTDMMFEVDYFYMLTPIFEGD